ncbi:MAG: endonuclease III [Burkholderiales bacterium]|nr:endonuclease III [Burkholderiales bacterium]
MSRVSLKKRIEQSRDIFTILRAANPNPTTELNYTSGFELLIAVILSAQATDVGVNKATAKLYPIANTAKQIADLGIEGIIPYIKTIGLYQTKAKNVIATAQILVDKYAGEVPRTREELEALPGVGRKTANVVLNTLYREPAMAVDTHIFRLSNRLGIAKGKTVREVEDKLIKVIPDEFILDAHHWMILHGRYVCKARTPECDKCSICMHCDYFHSSPRL